MSKGQEWEAVTEVGTFGSMEVKDPTVKKVEQAEEPIHKQIDRAIEENRNKLRR